MIVPKRKNENEKNICYLKNTENKFKAIVALIIAVIINNTLPYVTTVAVMIIFQLYTTALSKEINNTTQIIAILLNIASLAYYFSAMFLFTKWYSTKIKNSATETKKNNNTQYIDMFITGFSSEYAISILITLIPLLIMAISPQMQIVEEATTAYESKLNSAGLTNITLFITLRTTLLTPYTEEIVYRGIIYNYVKKIIPIKKIALVVQAALFAIAHANLIQAIYAFVMGIILGSMTEKKGLKSTIVFHTAFNFAGITTSLLAQKMSATNTTPAWYLLLNFIVPIAGFTYVIIKKQKKERKKEKQCQQT